MIQSVEMVVETALERVEARLVYPDDVYIEISGSLLEQYGIVDAHFNEEGGIDIIFDNDDVGSFGRHEYIYVIRTSVKVTK